MVIKNNQIRHSNWSVGDILEDVRPSSPTRNQQFAITDYDPETQSVSLDAIAEDDSVKSDFIFSQIQS